jgi:hypothetical protein
MHYLRKNLYFFIIIYAALGLFDYWQKESVDWAMNLLQSLAIGLSLGIYDFVSTKKKAVD